MTKKQPTAEDIPAIRGSFNGTSFSSERREADAIQSYIDHITAVYAEFDQWRTPKNDEEMDADLEAYRAKYASLANAYYGAHGRVVSTMIAGPSNFPTRTMEKRNNTADKRRGEWIEWAKKRLAQLREKYDPVRIARALAAAPITSDDPEAVDKLQAKIEKAEKRQGLMKAANKIAKSKKLSDEEKVAQLTPLVGEVNAHQLLKPDWWGVGFAPFELTNNNANIRRMKERVAGLEAVAAKRDGKENASVQRGDITITQNFTENRLQIFFPGKPVTAVRDALKRCGFRWSPTNGCWQRQLNDNAIYAFETHVWPVVVAHGMGEEVRP